MSACKELSPWIMVAPNGAHKIKADHPNLPITIEEIRDETVACAAAGADALHLHVRDDAGHHTLDPGRYKEAIDEVHRALPGFPIQITTEAAGLFDVDKQLECLRVVQPQAASISIKEIARRRDLAQSVYGVCEDAGTSVQHILYDLQDWSLLHKWRKAGIVRAGQADVIFVLGRYAPQKAASTQDLDALAPHRSDLEGRFMVCAFGPAEQSVLCAAATKGADLRVGFENNIHAGDGQIAPSNAANVASLKAALSLTTVEGIPQ